MAHLAIRGGTREISPDQLPNWPCWDSTESAALLEVLNSGKWSRSAYENSWRQADSRRHAGQAPRSKVETFEMRFREFVETEHAIAVCNGTVGLEVSLRSLGIGRDDEVIVPAYSAFATLSSVMSVGARPVFVDVNPASGNLDPAQIAERISEKTRAIVAVHFGGVPCVMDEIRKIATEHRLFLIEDAAHAQGSRWKSQPLGGLADIGVFSFHQSKNLPCGEGGMIVTNDDQLAKTARSIHDCGRVPGGKWYQHQRPGTNVRLGEFQAAIGLCQLARVSDQVARRQAMIEYFLEQIRGVSFLKPPELPTPTSACSFHILLLRYDADAFHGIARHRLIAAANAEGLPCWTGYPAPLGCSKVAGPAAVSAASVPGATDLCTKSALWLDHYIFLADKTLVQSFANVFLKIDEHFKELAR